MRDRTIVTGFGPFLDIKDNPSSTLAEAIDRPNYELEVSYEAVDQFFYELDPESFDRLLLIGVAPGRNHLCAELFARNTYGDTADVDGCERDGAIIDHAPLLMESTLFGAEVLSELLVENPLLRMSLNAGAYLCNFSYYRALALFPDKQVGFLHIPTFETVPFEAQRSIAKEVLGAVEAQPILESMPRRRLHRYAS